MAIDQGVILPKNQAKVILDAFNIAPNDWIDPYSSMEIEYQGKKYLIMQREVWYPPDTSTTSPDGWHIVYAPSGEEIELMEQGDELLIDPTAGEPGLGDFIGIGKNLLTVAALGIGAYALVNVLGFLKTRR